MKQVQEEVTPMGGGLRCGPMFPLEFQGMITLLPEKPNSGGKKMSKKLTAKNMVKVLATLLMCFIVGLIMIMIGSLYFGINLPWIWPLCVIIVVASIYGMLAFLFGLVIVVIWE